MMAAREDYLLAAYNTLLQQDGSMDAFLEKEMGLDKEKLEKLKP